MRDSEYRSLIDDLAAGLEGRGLVSPAILLLEANRPLAFLGSQLLLLAEPLLGLFGWAGRAQQWSALLQDPSAVDYLLLRLEHDRTQGES